MFSYFIFFSISFFHLISYTISFSPLTYESTHQGFAIQVKINFGIHYGKPHIPTFTSLLDINANKTIIHSSVLSYDIISHYSQNQVNGISDNINCIIMNQNTYFDNQDLGYKVYILTNSSTDMYSTDSLPLAHNVEDSDFSVLHSLLRQNKISYLRFRLSPSTSKLYLGGLPYDALYSTYKQSIKINELYYTWGANLSSFAFDYENGIDFYYVNNYDNYAYFTTRSIYVTLHQKVFNFIGNNVLRKFIYNKTCDEYKSFGRKTFICKCSVIEDLPYTYLTFNKQHHIGIHLSKLFRKCKSTDETTESVIQSYHDNLYKNDSITEIGTYFIQQFETEFDLETKEIHFYSEEEFPTGDILNGVSTHKHQNKLAFNSTQIKKIIIYNIIVIICGFLIEIIFKYLNN